MAMAAMRVNTVRLYAVDPRRSHAKFMAYAESLGIYVVLPLTGTTWGYLDAGRAAPSCYTATVPGYGHLGANLLWHATAVVAQFSGYPNALAFVAANELVLHGEATNTGFGCVPCLKALVRDVHAFQSG